MWETLRLGKLRNSDYIGALSALKALSALEALSAFEILTALETLEALESLKTLGALNALGALIDSQASTISKPRRLERLDCLKGATVRET